MFLMPSIGRILERSRKDRRLSQFDVAAATGTSPALVSFAERGRLPGNLRTLRDFAEFVGADFGVIHAILVENLPTLRAARHRLVFDLESTEKPQTAPQSARIA